ncbi:MAG: DUF2339 domain-containing protein [Gallionella sp.]
MTGVLVIIGALMGASSSGIFGFIVGAILGYLLGATFSLREQVNALKQNVKLLMAARVNQKMETSSPVQTSAPSPQAPPDRASAAIKDVSKNMQVSADELERQTLAEQSAEPMPAPAVQPRPIPPMPIPQAIEPAPPGRTAIEPVDEPAIISYLRNYFSGENILARVGVIVLFFGVAFLLKYAAERSNLSIEFRLMGVAIGSMVMLVIGWRLRSRHEDYALVLQGGGIGVLYLTVFAAMRLYQVLPPELTLIILTSVVFFSAILAIIQNASSLAILGICGGFLAPILTSTGGGNHVVLFSYYALLNAGIFGMAWFKAWRPLNLLGFVFTFVIATFWGVTRYNTADFASTEPFLIIYFLFYVGIAVLYANRQAPQLKSYVDGTLVFGTPIIAFGLQAGMMQRYEMLQIFEHGLAVSAMVLSLFYLLLAKILFDRKRDTLRLMVESFIALGVVFATLALPLALDGRWTSAAWALEGAAVVWMGVRQHRLLARLFGSLLQFAAGFSLLTDYHYYAVPMAIFNSIYIGGVLVSLGGLFSAWFMHHNKSTLKDFEHAISYALFGWGVLWWLGAGLREINRFVSSEYIYSATLAFIALSSFAFSLLIKRLIWPVARIPALGLLPAMWVIAYIQWFAASHPFAGAAYIGWLLAFAMIYLILHRHENMLTAAVTRYFHMGVLWLLTLLAAREAAWAINDLVQGQGTWPLIAWAVMPGLILGALSLRGQRLNWPVAAHLKTYFDGSAVPLAAFLWLWSLFANLNSDGNPYPISYLPLLNPLDLAQIFVFIVLAFWLMKIRELGIAVFTNLPREGVYAAIAATLFIWLNAALLRTLHYWADVPFNMQSMLHSVLVQTSISIFWSVLAMAMMRYAVQKHLRALWMAGGVLMGAVVLKLFTIDISGIGSLERIVSFIGVAVLMLIIGYIAPLPAKQQEASKHA